VFYVHVAKAVVVARETSDERVWAGVGFRPRPLMPIANKPVLFHSLEALQAGGIEAVAIVVGGATRDDVRSAVGDGRRWRVSVEYLEAPSDIGLVDVLHSADAFLTGEPFVVQEGDALVRHPIGALGDRFSREDLDALVLRLPAPHRPHATRADGQAPATLAPFAGCFLGARVLRASFEPGLELPALLARVRKLGGRVQVEQVDGCLPCRGGPEALLDANRRALEYLPEQPVSASLEKSDLQGRVVVHRTARLHRALVRGPAIIGPRTHVTDAYVGPYTSLGADVVIEGSEVEHSIVLDGACIRFLGARLEASIVGCGARIGRDFALPQAVRLLVGDRAEVTLT
jgi:glucose-1-phosphate thymidylyltransferase